MPRQECPSEGELRDYLLGSLSSAALEDIEQHVEACPRCEHAIEQLDNATDPLLAGLRNPTTQTRPKGREGRPQHIGQHEILELLGAGGMGVVYKARDLRLQRVVALKVMQDHDDDPLRRMRFRRETEVIARLQHPGIVQIFEVGEDDPGKGQPRAYFTQEYVEGGCLATRLTGRPQPPRQAALWLEAIARAVEHAHQNNVVHRDLKPSNILLTADGQPKVCDFGVAKLLASPSATVSGTLIGTADYMAPEQALGRSSVGPPADIHALGCILYDLLTGRPPFRGADRLETLQLVISQEPVPPRQLNPAVPSDLDTICLKCLEKEPGRRYASAQALANDLRAFLDGLPIRARRLGRLARAWRWCGRNPREATLAGLALLAVFVAVVGWAMLAELQRRQTHRELGLLREQTERTSRTSRAVDDALDEVAARRRAAKDSDPAELAVALSVARRAVTLVESEPVAEDQRMRVRRVLADVERLERAARRRAEQARKLAEQAVRDRHLEAVLRKIHWQAPTRKDGQFDLPSVEAAYHRAYREYGLDLDRLEVRTAAARIRGSNARVELLAGLDGWILVRKGIGKDWKRLIEVARKADPDPVRDRMRLMMMRGYSRADILRLGEEARTRDLPEATALLLGTLLPAHGGVQLARAILRRAQRRFPGNFGLSLALAGSYALNEPKDLQEAIRFYTAAAGLREDLGVLLNLGRSLAQLGRLNEAIPRFQHCLSLAPDQAEVRLYLAICLFNKGRMDEALDAFRALVRQRGSAEDCQRFGSALIEGGHPDEAESVLRRAIRLQPGAPDLHILLGMALLRQNKFRAGRAALLGAQKLTAKKSPPFQDATQALQIVENLLKLQTQLPAILSGTAEVPAEQQPLVAEMCAVKGLTEAGARLYEKCFAAQPAALADRNVCLGYSCARVAARAGCGEGKDAASLKVDERARWRKVALGRLRKELELWGKQPRSQPAERLAVQRGVRKWLYDPALAGVRAPARLAKLPAAEQKDWRRLWADVRAFLRQFRDDP
jgi:tetratricopeptide (TPR) repeat protein/tRNA A-37 threonylcarbamoyl transferase component Bud32